MAAKSSGRVFAGLLFLWILMDGFGALAANGPTSVTVGSQSVALTYGTGGSPTFTINASGNGNLNVNWSVLFTGGTPAGVSTSFSPNPSPGNGSWSSTLTVTTTGSTPAGGFSFTVTNNQTVTTGAGTLTVGQKTLTPTVTLNNKVYDGTTAATTVATRSLSGIINSDDVNLGTSGTVGVFSSKNVAAYTPTVSGLSLSGTTAGNYVLSTTSVTPSASITAKALTVSGSTAASTIYDGTTTAKLGGTAAFQTAEAAAVGTGGDGKPYTGNGDVISIGGTAVGTLAAKDVGTQAVTITGVTATGTGSGNYTVTQQTGLTQAVTQKALTVSGITAASTIYDGTTTAKLGGTAAFQATEAAGAGTTSDGKPYNVDSVTAGGTAAGTLAAKDVGTQAVTITGVTTGAGAGFGNYTVTQQTGLTQAITQKALTAVGTLVFPASKVYDGTTTATPTSGSAALQTAETTGSGNTSDGKPYTGNGDVVSLTGTASYSFNTKDVATATTVTASGLSLTGTGNGNYTLTAPTFSETITARPITVTAASNTKPYDGTTSAAAIPSGNALQNGDVITSGESYDNANVGAAHVLTPATVVIKNSAQTVVETANYTISTATVNTGTINPQSLTILRQTGLNSTKVLKSVLADLAVGATISSFASTSAAGATISNDGTWVFYAPTEAINANDTFTYTASGATGTVNVNIDPGTTAQSLNMLPSTGTPGTGDFTIHFAGILGFTYTVQWAPTVTGTWTTLGTATADSTTGQGSYIDPDGHGGTAFYRTVYP